MGDKQFVSFKGIAEKGKQAVNSLNGLSSLADLAPAKNLSRVLFGTKNSGEVVSSVGMDTSSRFEKTTTKAETEHTSADESLRKNLSGSANLDVEDTKSYISLGSIAEKGKQAAHSLYGMSTLATSASLNLLARSKGYCSAWVQRKTDPLEDTKTAAESKDMRQNEEGLCKEDVTSNSPTMDSVNSSIAPAIGFAAGGAVTLVGAPLVLSAMGFGAGIAAGSVGASMMSSAATTGVGLPVVSALQSAGAAGFGLATKALLFYGGGKCGEFATSKMLAPTEQQTSEGHSSSKEANQMDQQPPDNTAKGEGNLKSRM